MFSPGKLSLIFGINIWILKLKFWFLVFGFEFETLVFGTWPLNLRFGFLVFGLNSRFWFLVFGC